MQPRQLQQRRRPCARIHPQFLRFIATLNRGEASSGAVGFADGRRFSVDEGELIGFFAEPVRSQLQLEGYVPLTHASPFDGNRLVMGRRTAIWTVFVEAIGLRPRTPVSL